MDGAAVGADCAADDGAVMQSGLAMLAASSQSFSGDNLKHVEEHGTAEARAVAVHGDTLEATGPELTGGAGATAAGRGDSTPTMNACAGTVPRLPPLEGLTPSLWVERDLRAPPRCVSQHQQHSAERHRTRPVPLETWPLCASLW